MQNIVGFDFSIVKPAACVLSDNKYFFYLWPKDLKDKDVNILTNVNININLRQNIEIIDKVRYDITNANILSNLIIDSLTSFINKDTMIALEGASFASKGNMVISLMTWKYLLIYKLSLLIPLENVFTYAPPTIKSIAGCATKDKKGKNSMIEAFKKENINHLFCDTLINFPEKLKKKTNYIAGIDDCVDAYFVLKTLQIKEKF